MTQIFRNTVISVASIAASTGLFGFKNSKQQEIEKRNNSLLKDTENNYRSPLLDQTHENGLRFAMYTALTS